jgi:hypothetical protein
MAGRAGREGGTATAVAARRLSKSSPPTYPRTLRRPAAQEHSESAQICVNLRIGHTTELWDYCRGVTTNGSSTKLAWPGAW